MPDEYAIGSAFPVFFDLAPKVTLKDPLARFLGAAHEGTMEYSYADAVRLAGHSCPTVAGAYLMTLRGLQALYGDEVPVRGEVAISMSDSRDSGTTGVMATVAQLITGAAPETGFGGIAGRFQRKDLLDFDQPVSGIMGMQRTDNGQAVQVDLDASVVLPSPEMRVLLGKAVNGEASDEELARFGELWQDRVKRMLLEHADDPVMIQVSPWSPN